MPPSWTNTPSGTMTAAVLNGPAGSRPALHSFKLDTSYPKPTIPSQDWILLRVRAAGLNQTELRSRAGEKQPPMSFGMFAPEYHPNIPAVLGSECVGEVEVAGSNTGFKQGDRVAAAYYGGGKAYDGSYAQYTIVKKEACQRLPGPHEMQIGDGPGQVSWSALGACLGSGWTAWGSLFQSAQTKQGDTVLIRGATSSVGVWAVLLAKAHKCSVIATTRSEAKVAKLKSMGADHVVVEQLKDGKADYEKMIADVHQIKPEGVNVVLELIDINAYSSLGFKVLAKYGTCVVTGAVGSGFTTQQFTPFMIPSTRKLTLHGGFAVTDGVEECFKEIISGIQSGTFKEEQFLDKVYTLDKVGEVHDAIEKSQFTGKVVIAIP